MAGFHSDISYEANPTSAARTGTVTISSSGADNSPFTVEISQGMMGDIDTSKTIDLADAILALRVLAGITDVNVVIADVNGDGKIGLSNHQLQLMPMAHLNSLLGREMKHNG